jgi:DNA polymerase
MSNLTAPPPPPSYGLQLAAGLRYSTVLADFDFETYSEAGYLWNESLNKWQALPGVQPSGKGLPSVGAAVYSAHPTAEVLRLAYDLKDGRGKHSWRPGEPLPVALFIHLIEGKLLEAWNVGFERWVWRNICETKYGFPPLPESQLRCAMAKGRAFCLPGSLDNAAKVLNTRRKDADGARLMKLFSMPQNPTKKRPLRRVLPDAEPVEFARYAQYNDTDIVAEAEVSARTPDLTPIELEYWQIDQAINVRGVHIDRAGVDNCISLVQQAHDKYNRELQAITGGTVQAASELQKLKGWVGAHGVHLDVMDEEALTLVLKRSDLPPPVRRVIEIRAAIGSASVKKVFAMANQATRHDRLHDLFSFHATRTGRPTGNGPQPTNLPNSGPEVLLCASCGHYSGMLWGDHCPHCDHVAPRKPLEWCVGAVEEVLGLAGLCDLSVLEFYFGEAMPAISGCLRGLFNAAPGHDLISSDYTAIEAVVLAELAGEQWRIDLFKAGGKIYEATGAVIEGLTYEDVLAHATTTGKHHPCRKKGKVAELASGYQGWIGAWCAFGADSFMTEDEIKAAILKWRGASPNIVEFWGGQRRGYNGPQEFYGVEGAAIQAILNPGQVYDCRGLKFIKRGTVMYITLLSGRCLTYHNIRLEASERGGYAILYDGQNTNPNNGPFGWITLKTWGGRLVENITQATANDLLRFASVNLERAGYPIVLHVYDEIVAEVPEGFGTVEEFEAIMAQRPAWAADWPVSAAGGWRGSRYRK